MVFVGNPKKCAFYYSYAFWFLKFVQDNTVQTYLVILNQIFDETYRICIWRLNNQRTMWFLTRLIFCQSEVIRIGR